MALAIQSFARKFIITLIQNFRKRYEFSKLLYVIILIQQFYDQKSQAQNEYSEKCHVSLEKIVLCLLSIIFYSNVLR